MALFLFPAVCATAQQATASPTAKPAAQASAGVLLDALYPGGVPAEPASGSQAQSAATTATAGRPTTTTQRVTLATTTTAPAELPAVAGTVRVRRTRNGARHAAAALQDAAHVELNETELSSDTLSTATLTTATLRTTDTLTTAARALLATTASLARAGVSTASLTALEAPAAQAPGVRVDLLQTTATTHPTTGPAAVLLPPAGAPPNPDGVWINRATPQELEHKLHLDARRARLLVEFRRIYGPFRSPDDLTQVTGITDDMVRLWESNDLLFFE